MVRAQGCSPGGRVRGNMTYGDDISVPIDDDEFDTDDEYYSEDEDAEYIYDDEVDDADGSDRWDPSGTREI